MAAGSWGGPPEKSWSSCWILRRPGPEETCDLSGGPGLWPAGLLWKPSPEQFYVDPQVQWAVTCWGSQIRISSLTLRLTSRHYETLVNESELQQPRLRDLLISRCYLMFSDIFLNYLFISRPRNESLRLQSTCCSSAETLKVSIYSQLDSSGPSGGRLVVYR